MRIHKILIALLAVLTAISLAACSPDIEEKGEVLTLTTEDLYSPPEPHWADGTITIETGQHETGESMVDALDDRRNFHAFSASLRIALSKKGLKMSKEKRTVEVTVLTLGEAGFTELATLKEIRKRFEEMGCRPLTLEEAVMTRLDFVDQPDIKRVNHKMTNFFTLLSEEDGYFLGRQEKEKVLKIKRDSTRDKYGEGYLLSFALMKNNMFGPQNAFACVKHY